MNRVMYVKPGCPYCQQARDALTAEGHSWDERDATTRDDWRTELLEHSRGTGMVPTLLEDGHVVTVGWKGRG
jgi:glutaredoxin 3